MLKLFHLVEGNETSFIIDGSQLEIGAFTYSAARMGSAPTLSATLNYPTCLDGEWDDSVYVNYKGERYFLKQIPTSSYNSESVMYKHELEFVSERIALENVYFYDVVDADYDDDKPVSNKSDFSFSGNIHEFAERLNQSLQYAGLEYRVVVDEGIETDDKLITVEHDFFSAVLQEAYNTYEVPYYFEGKTIHIGFTGNVIDEVFAYGVNDALMSINKTNTGNRIINRVTGLGSEDNIPYYYPNLSPKGEVVAKAGTGNKGITDANISILNYKIFSDKVELNKTITYVDSSNESLSGLRFSEAFTPMGSYDKEVTCKLYYNGYSGIRDFSSYFQVSGNIGDVSNRLLRIEPILYITNREWVDSESHNEDLEAVPNPKLEQITLLVYADKANGERFNDVVSLKDSTFVEYFFPNDITNVSITFKATYRIYGYDNSYVSISMDAISSLEAFWVYEGEKVSLEDLGLQVIGNAIDGDTITQLADKYVSPQKYLMPPKYRQTKGEERFYNALNNTYINPESETGEKYEFENPFIEGRPKEQIVQFEEIKPTIKEVENSDGLRIDMFSEFAYDRDDNDETYEDADGKTNYTHPYFFGKLRKLDFNLFDSAIEEGEMTIAMTSGKCGACEFIVGVAAEDKTNTVQVDDNGNLIYDENGNVLCGREDFQTEVDAQPRQQDTINNEVWIALRKDTKTFGELMPNASNDYRPTACEPGQNNGDTFVILHINLPQHYIEKAEEMLEEQLIRFMYDNNFEKFNFSIKFSRIYLAEHPAILGALDENARITIEYNGQEHPLYVSSYTYKVDSDNVLPEITVELKDELSISQNAVQRAVNKAVSEVYKTIGNIDVVAQSSPHFLRKDVPDTAEQQITFNKSAILKNGATIKDGSIQSDDYYSEIRGLAIYKDSDDNWHVETDYVNARKKFTAKEVEIQKVRHISGAQIKSSASIICSRVEDVGDDYRCYFDTTDADGNTIYNEFANGDQAYVQTFNLITDENGNNTNHFYWRLVTGVGEDFILLSKDICLEGSTVPMAGDNIVQLGCQDGSKPDRMVAVIDAGAGTGAPYYRQYTGINSFELPTPETQLKPNDNKFTGVVHIAAGSTGANNLEGLPEIVKEQIGDIEIGGQNMLRNSGFTGDYLSEQLADNSVLDATNEMFNPPFVHWAYSNATIQDSTESASGKEVVLNGGYLSQSLDFAVIANESYTLSFKAKGQNLTYNVGGVIEPISLTNEWVKYTYRITTVVSSKLFKIENAACVICELQLERGTIATAWSNSPFDNSSDRAYYQSLKYLNQSLNEGSTTINGGLVLTSHIKVGNYAEQEMIKETGGMQGSWVNDNSPFIWGGGTHEQALDTIAKYTENQSYQPTNEELATMAKFVVTHGGRAILNDIILRGYIYALGGVFNGTIYAKGGTFDGRLQMPFVSILKYDSTGDITSINIGNETYERYIVPLLPSYSSHIDASITYEHPYILGLPNSTVFDGWVLNVYCAPRVTRTSEVTGVFAIDSTTNKILAANEGCIYSSQVTTNDGFALPLRAVMCPSGGVIELVCVEGQWQVTNYIHNIQYLA